MPIEHLYLKTAAIPIPYIISARRLIYLQTILQRSDEEITKKIYQQQKTNPSPGDWCQLVRNDFDMIGEQSIDYDSLYDSVQEQKEFIHKYEKYLVLQDELIDDSDTQSSLPGLHTGPQLPKARTSAWSSDSNPI